MAIDRRDFLKLGTLGALTAGLPACHSHGESTPAQPATAPANSASVVPTPADYTIRIAPGLVELAPDRIIATTLYNGQFPGPLIRLREGNPVTVDLYNDTDTPEQLHWHGQMVPVEVDGAAEEGTPFIPPHGHRRISFTPGPAGVRFYHTHAFAGPDLRAGQYGGQVGIVYIEPKHEPGAYDREVFLMLKEFEPSFSRGGDMPADFLAPATRNAELEAAGESSMKASLSKGMPHGFEVGYRSFSINGRMLGHGEPIRVKAGERVLLHVVNGSASEIRSLALPGHSFQVVALDGNPVPTPVELPVLWIGTGERVSAIVQMSHPGVWILGDVGDDRANGMGIVVEYAGAKGAPRWIKPPRSTWDYTRFARPTGTDQPPDKTIEMIFSKQNAEVNGFNRWLIDGAAFSMTERKPMFSVQHGRRYRLRMRNASDDIHPMHLHRHTFEVTKVAGRSISGLMKDVVMLGGYQEVEIDFTATGLGLSLFHCHMQLHMDFGFMALFDCE
jgi:FtsP/CotA-like multicopper oxidase with cupredoxin domain